MVIDAARVDDIDGIMDLETAGFEKGVRERRDVFLDRLVVFPDGFFVVRPDSSPRPAKLALSAYLCAWLRNSRDTRNAAAFELDTPLSGKHVPDGDEIYLASLVVDPALRGQGLARLLIEAAVDRLARERPGLESALLLVNEEWHGAARLYASMGFAEIGGLPGFFGASNGKAADGVLMRRRIERAS